MEEESNHDGSQLDPAFDGVLRRDPRGSSGGAAGGGARCEYYQDRHKRWAFSCDEDGATLLTQLLRAATPVVGAVQAKIDAAHGVGRGASCELCWTHSVKATGCSNPCP
jgi:hypothetical protein